MPLPPSSQCGQMRCQMSPQLRRTTIHKIVVVPQFRKRCQELVTNQGLNPTVKTMVQDLTVSASRRMMFGTLCPIARPNRLYLSRASCTRSCTVVCWCVFLCRTLKTKSTSGHLPQLRSNTPAPLLQEWTGCHEHHQCAMRWHSGPGYIWLYRLM